MPTGFTYEWLDPDLRIFWDAVEGATSYQLAFSTDGESWEELYSGEDNFYEYEPPEGLRYYRVRARNANGYGDWSETVEYNAEGTQTLGEWPSPPSNLAVKHITDPGDFMLLSYDALGGAESYTVYRAFVPIGEPAPDMPVDPFASGIVDFQFADNDITMGNAYYYWDCGVQAGVEGESAGPVMCEYM